MKLTHFIFVVLILAACNSGEQDIKLPVPTPAPVPQKESILESVDDRERIVWQKPEEVVKILGDISEKTIADIGAGSGYFTFRFALKAEKVIAIDIDPGMIQIIETFKQQLPEPIQSKIETRLAKPNNPMLKDGEADLIVIINTIAYIQDRRAYLQSLKKGLKPGGEIFILDFKAKKLTINAPDMQYRIPLGTLEQDIEKAGFDVFNSDDRTLDYQYILRARLAE